MYFTSPTSNITPSLASVAMSRSDSRDSTYSLGSSSQFPTAPMTVSYCASPSTYLHPLTRTRSSESSASSSQSGSFSVRRESNSQWLPSPYRSCMMHSASTSGEEHEPSSYISDDDLLFLTPPPNALPIETISNPEPVLGKNELTTEEQIAMLREMQEKEQEIKQKRGSTASNNAMGQKTVRFASNNNNNSRRPSTLRRRNTAVRKGLSNLNGPM